MPSPVILKTAQAARISCLSATSRDKNAEALSKDAAASRTPRSDGLVRVAHEHAVFLDNQELTMRGFVDAISLLIAALGVGVAWWAWSLLFLVTHQPRPTETSTLSSVVGWVIALGVGALVASCFALAIRGFRDGMFGPKFLPIVFNRQTRKVYHFSTDSDYSIPLWDSLRHPFKSRPLLVIEYDWACLEAEYVPLETRIRGRTLIQHILNFYARDWPGSDTVVHGFFMATPEGRQRALDLWEFIRRFMEEDGPVLNPGDKPAPDFPATLLQSARSTASWWWLPLVGSFVWSLLQWWEHGLQMVGGRLHHILWFCAITFGGVTTMSIFFNWLTFRFFGQDVTLPLVQLAEAGKPLDLKRLAAEAHTP